MTIFDFEKKIYNILLILFFVVQKYLYLIYYIIKIHNIIIIITKNK